MDTFSNSWSLGSLPELTHLFQHFHSCIILKVFGVLKVLKSLQPKIITREHLKNTSGEESWTLPESKTIFLSNEWVSSSIWNLYFLNHCWQWLQAWNSKTLAPWKESYDKPRQYIKKQRYHFPDKDPSSQSYGFFSSHVWMWELYYKESWALKNWCFWTVVLEKTPESPLDSKEIKPVNLKTNQLWIFIGRTDAKTEAPILRPPDRKSQLIGKDADAGKYWRQKEKGVAEGKMIR